MTPENVDRVRVPVDGSPGGSFSKNLRYRKLQSTKIGTYFENDVPSAWLKQNKWEITWVVLQVLLVYF